MHGTLFDGNDGCNLLASNLDSKDYWSAFKVINTGLIRQLKFTSFNGVIVEGGGPSIGQNKKFGSPVEDGEENVRIISIEGWRGTYLDRIVVEYVQNYSKLRTIATDVPAIFACVSG